MSYFNSNPELTISLIIFGITMMIMPSCLPSEEEKAAAEVRHSRGCSTKHDRGRPACWTETDWEIYCQRVNCKR